MARDRHVKNQLYMMNCSKLLSKFLFVFLFLFSIYLTSCKKDLGGPAIPTTGSKDDPIPPFVFNWETATYMPSNPANVVPMPWQGAVGGVDGDIVGDYKSADGWELVYNTFNYSASPYLNQTPPGGLYFALYNSFRGLLRFYLYVPSGTATPTANIAHGLSLYPQGSTNSSMLNFEGSDITDVAVNKSGIIKTNNQQINLMGNWIATQYEIAYDPNISNTSYPSLGLQWNTQAVNVTGITLNGTQTGTVKNALGTAQGGGFNPGSLFAGLTKAALQSYGQSAIQSELNDLPPEPSVQRSFLTGISSALTSAVSGNVGGVITGLFNVVFGGNSSNAQSVNLVMNTQINLTGNLTNSVGLTNPFLVMPGQSNSQTANGPIPNYNSIMGVFNITAKPIVQTQSTVVATLPNTCGDPSTSGNIGSYAVRLSYTLDNNSYQVVFNPAVTANATITNITSTLLIYDVQPGFAYTGNNDVTNGTPETIGLVDAYRAPTYFTFAPIGLQCGYQEAINNLYKAAVRISFDVVPNNGAPQSTIVKTFAATLQ